MLITTFLIFYAVGIGVCLYHIGYYTGRVSVAKEMLGPFKSAPPDVTTGRLALDLPTGEQFEVKFDWDANDTGVQRACRWFDEKAGCNVTERLKGGPSCSYKIDADDIAYHDGEAIGNYEGGEFVPVKAEARADGSYSVGVTSTASQK